MNLIHVSLALIVGFLLGGMACYFAYGKLFSKHQLQDELTSTRRELANSKRALNDFFVNADSQFVLLDKNFRQFAAMMAEAASRLNQSPELFDISRDEGKKGKAAAAEPEEETEEEAAARENAERAAELKKDKAAAKAAKAQDLEKEKPAAGETAEPAPAKAAAADEAEEKPAAAKAAAEKAAEPAAAEPPKDFVVEEKAAAKPKI